MERRITMNGFIVALVYITSVHISAKRYIQFKEEPSDLVATRNKPAELRCIVAATNNATISWTRNGVKVDVINDTRRRILPRGSLYFTTIIRRKKLSPDAGVYRCIGETEVNGRSFKIISREARLSIAGLSKAFAVAPQSMTVREGDTVFFECKIKRSVPEAKITWSMEGRNTDLTLNFRFVVFPSGTLEILSVLKSDAGNYICKASNEKTGRTSVATTSTLTVTPASTAPRPSRFLVKPSDVVVFQNENAILECIVTGYPKPQVEWYKDGSPISLTQGGRYSKYGESSLNVSAAQARDSGKYECMIGTMAAAADLQVLVRPQFKVLPKDVEADESDDVTFQCEASGHPTPAITWYKNGDVIDEVKFEHISVGDDEITIMEALESDEGIYQCFARNDGGEIIASAQLNVRDPPTAPPPTTAPAKTKASVRIIAPSAPKNVKAATESATAIRVSWDPPEKPHGKITNYTVVAYKMDAGDPQFESMVKTQNTHLVVVNLQPETSYEFVVYASNEHKRGAVSESVEERTAKRKTPSLGPPQDVKVFAVGSMALKVTWKQPLNALQVINSYSIEYRDIDRDAQWRTESSLKYDVVLLKLRAYTKYAVKVTAHTDYGRGQTSSAVIARTKSGKPSGPPLNVILIATNDSLVARWSPPSVPNGNLTGYVIELKNEKSGKVATSGTTKNSKVFMNVARATTYAMRVAAVTAAGRGEFSYWKRKDTPPPPITEAVVPGKPMNLRTRVIAGMVRVSWDPPEESHIIFREYVLSYGKLTPDDKFKTLSNTTTTYLLRNLQSGTSYIIRVRAKNRQGQGLEALEKVDIPQKKQSPGIYNLRAVPIKKRTMKLSWIDPTLNVRPNVVYHVKYEDRNSLKEFNVTKRTSYIVKNLRPGMRYTFYVKKNDEVDYVTVSNVTREEVPSAPKDVTISISDKEGAVRVHWNSPDEQNGKLTNYRICWRPEDNLRNYNWTCKNVKGNVLNENIYNINATLAYHVRILAKNRAGEGEFSEPAKFFGDSVIKLSQTPSTEDSSLLKSTVITPDDRPPAKNDVPVFTFGDIVDTPTAKSEEKTQVATKKGLSSDAKTLWIVIAVIAAITLVAIVIISIILCKKRSRGGTPVALRKLPVDRHKALPNGNSKKKQNSKDNNDKYWIKQDQMEPCPFLTTEESLASTIPRSADEMKPLDSPFQSRKGHESFNKDEDTSPEPDERPYKHKEDYQPLPMINNINIHKSPFMPPDDDEFPPPPENLDNDDEEGPSSDYGSEEMGPPKSETGDATPVTYMPKNTRNGPVSVAPDYDYHVSSKHDIESRNLENLMKDLDAIMAKEDRV